MPGILYYPIHSSTIFQLIQVFFAAQVVNFLKWIYWLYLYLSNDIRMKACKIKLFPNFYNKPNYSFKIWQYATVLL